MEQTINQILKKAITLHQEGNFEEAKQLYHSILKTQPSNLDANNNLGVLLIAINKADEAEVCFKKVIELKPDFVEAHHNLGNALDKLNRLDEAEVCFKKAIELKPDFVDAHNNLGNILMKLNRLDEAEVCFKKVIELKPEYANAHYNLGIIYFNLKKNKEAIKKYSKVLEIDPKHTGAQELLIYNLDFFSPKEKNVHPIITANNSLKEIKNTFTLEDGIKDHDFANLFRKSNKIIENYVGKLVFNHAQIHRRNSIELNCKRHKGIFNEFNIVPKFCFSCFKIQIEPKNVLELCKLYLIFDKLKLPTDNSRKCTIELRPNATGTYKGLIYCSSIKEMHKIIEIITPTINRLIKGKIKIKRGCTEYSEIFPNYEVTDAENINFMKYQNEWDEKEKIFDKNNKKAAEGAMNSLSCGLSISDVLIMNNWLNYAKKINDLTYKDISEEIIYSDFITKIMSNQLDVRKKSYWQTV